MLVLLVLTSITAITLDFRDTGSGFLNSARSGARDTFAPLQRVLGNSLSSVGDFFGGLTRYGSVKSENARLRSQLDAVKAERVAAADAERERRLLLALANLDFVGSLPSLTARVISDSASNFQRTVAINKGRSAGIDTGMPVVTEAGLVGRVTAASNGGATVLLITDPSSNIGVRLNGSGDVGVLTGAGRDPLPMDLVNLDTKVVTGEGLVTSGLQDGLFPPQIPVGRVRSVRTSPGALNQQVTVDPVVDFGRLDLVKVLVWKPVR